MEEWLLTGGKNDPRTEWLEELPDDYEDAGWQEEIQGGDDRGLRLAIYRG